MVIKNYFIFNLLLNQLNIIFNYKLSKKISLPKNNHIQKKIKFFFKKNIFLISTIYVQINTPIQIYKILNIYNYSYKLFILINKQKFIKKNFKLYFFVNKIIFNSLFKIKKCFKYLHQTSTFTKNVNLKLNNKKTNYKNIFLKKKQFNFFNIFLINFLNFFLKKKFFLLIHKLNPLIKKIDFNSKLKFLLFKFKKKFKKKVNWKASKILYKIIFLSLKLKDSSFFLKWLKYKLEKIYFTKHKSFIYFLKIFFKHFFNHFKLIVNIKGVFFYIGGKISVSGDSKKRHLFFNFGKHSSSTKDLKINYARNQVRTETGVLGINFSIFF